MFDRLNKTIVTGGTYPAPPEYLNYVHAIESVDRKRYQPLREGYFPVHVSTAINFAPENIF